MGAIRNPAPEPSLYDRDFCDWALHMAEVLRDRNAAALDWDNLAEEIQGLAGRDRRELFSRMKVLLHHLLKWKLQPDMQCRSWNNTIRHQREEIELLLNDSPSLRRRVVEAIDAGYERAAGNAVEEMGLLKNPFPEKCPFTAGQVLDTEFLPA